MNRRLVGWRAGVLSFAVSALLVFLFNLIVTTWAVSKHPPDADGTSVIYEGSCSSVRSINTGAHLIINILSVILLSGSNYCMQCLSAPTRAEVDSAHAAGVWLDIGIPSLRNLRWVNSKRLTLWCLLGISSLPLHLFYNSSVFASTSASAYWVFPVNEDFLSHGPNSTSSYYNQDAFSMYHDFLSNKLDRLEPAACVDAYTGVFQSNRGDVLLVSQPVIKGQQVYAFPEPADTCRPGQSYQWVCNQYQDFAMECLLPCDTLLPKIRANISNWQPFGTTVKYCLSQPSEEHCQIEFSTTISWLVISLNFLKFVLMCATIFVANEAPLMTIGDAISSFIKIPDPTTSGMCLASKREFIGQQRLRPALPRRFVLTPQRKFAAASRNRWVFCILLYMGALALCCSLLAYGISMIQGSKSPTSLFSLGLGTVNARTVIASRLPIQGKIALLSNIFLANVPQLILSAIYFTYNALFTCMSVVSEWSNFAEHRKSLRVSGIPTGSQRTTYFLQLPYRLGIPLVFLSGILHWLFSQSIFLVSIHVYDNAWQMGNFQDYRPYDGFITCGWSPLGVICVIVLGICMMLWLAGTGLGRLSTGIPMAASCSAAISAACHPSHEEPDAWQMGLKWGEVSLPDQAVGHCSFSSRDVTFPREGALYAGHAHN